MRRLFAVTGLLFAAAALGAEPVIVLGKGRLAADVTSPTPAETALIQTVATALPAETSRPLITPPEWGRTVAGASGEISLAPPLSNIVVLHVRLQGLAPSHRYLLTLNGKPGLPGNDRLPDPVPGLPEERYFDFFTATTDEHGTFASTFGIALPAGRYETRFYVKDTADFKIVLYHDYFPYAVK